MLQIKYVQGKDTETLEKNVNEFLASLTSEVKDIVKANCFNDAKIEAEHKALDLTNGQQRVISLGKGYELQVGGGCHW